MWASFFFPFIPFQLNISNDDVTIREIVDVAALGPKGRRTRKRPVTLRTADNTSGMCLARMWSSIDARVSAILGPPGTAIYAGWPKRT
jgi:hypothetical protein